VNSARILAGVRAGFLCIVGTVSVGACSKPDAVRLRVTNQGATEAERLLDLRVFVGADKSWWPAVAPQETVGVVLDPGGERPKVVMSFKSHGTETHWQGPDLDAGRGYTIVVTIASGGGVEEAHCRMPCSLR
jgi:hypothetical protein